jgi:hypothetical protein
MNTTKLNNWPGAKSPKPAYLSHMPNGTPFVATLKFAKRSEAVEAMNLIDTLSRSLPVKAFDRVGYGKKDVQFYCDGPATAKLVRARYFRNQEISWPTTEEEQAAVAV